MRIKSFRIQKYRNIQDSGEVTLEDNLTCIVGKNQSGKTALLRALHKFNPHDDHPYDLNREWPRGERRKKNPKQVVCSVTFNLTELEHTELVKLISSDSVPFLVTVHKDYEGNFEFVFNENPDLVPDTLHPNDVDRLCADLPSLSSEASEAFKEETNKCSEEVHKLAKEGRFTELVEITAKHEERLNSKLSPPRPNTVIRQNESAYVTEYSQWLSELSTKLDEEPTVRQKVHEYIIEQIPTFIYMDDFREFEGTAILTQVRDRLAAQSLTPIDETFLMILKLAGLNLEELIKQGTSKNRDELHERQLNLEDGAKTLTKEVATRWGQNPYRIQFRADGQTFFTEIEETTKDIGILPLEEQSKGFRWFFSFDLRFMHDSEGTFEGCVLLLDEPGLHLHPGGQQDLLKRLDEYSEKNTLIYTTHLPFLVDLREPHRIRVISQTGDSAIVSLDLHGAAPDEKLTLQAALGMKLDQHYLIADRNLVVEGAHDYYLLNALSNLLIRLDKTGLPEDLRITAAGGAPEAVYMSTFMIGQGLGVITLFDSDKEGVEQEKRLREKWLTRYKEVPSSTVLLGAAIDDKNSVTIEDLFDEKFYLTHLNQSHKNKLKAVGQDGIKSLSGHGEICNRAEATCRQVGIEFNKGSVAKSILHAMLRMKDIKELPPHTLERTEKLIGAINKEYSKMAGSKAA